MTFYSIYERLKTIDFEAFFASTTTAQVQRVLEKEVLEETDFLLLLSPAAEPLLEEMARKAQRLTVQHFGRVILLYTPLYVADYCVNHCVYCSFSVIHPFERQKLTMAQIEQEAIKLRETGIQHVLILTGESPQHTPVSYLIQCVEVLKNYFPSISIEVQPLETNEYKQLVDSGVDGLVVYQEVYNEETYKSLHLKGPKRLYLYRLDTAERACQAGMRQVNIGALLGLDDWRKEAFFSGMHAHYLQHNYFGTDICLSLPRIRPNLGCFNPHSEVQDKHLVQILLATRLFLPRVGISLSTRERAELRDQLIPLGVTRMSSGSSTTVGGYASSNDTAHSQFQTSDERSTQEVYHQIIAQGYQPIFKDWGSPLDVTLRHERK